MIAPINLFEGDTTLVTMVFDDSFTRFGVVGAFSNCTNLTKVIIPNSIDSIAPYTFKNTNLTSIAIPNSVTVIDSEAFDGCTNLTTIYYSGTAEDINANNWGATNATLKPYSEAPSELLP